MPKLRKETVNKIEELIQAGYINAEIRDFTSVSLPTIRNIRKGLESEKSGKESRKSVESEIFGKENVIEVGEGKDYEKVEFLDLKGKKVRFTDVVDESMFKEGFWLQESTLQHVIDEFIWNELADLKETNKRLKSSLFMAHLKQHFECNDCRSKGQVAVNVKCTKCGREVWWGFRPE